MRCPVCFRAILARRVGPGLSVPCCASRRYVVSAPCPHPGCGARLFAWTEGADQLPGSVTTSAGFLAWRRHARPPLVPPREIGPALVVATVMAAFVSLATWAMWRTLELSPDVTSRVIFGIGPALVVLSQIGFAWLGVREAVEIRCRDSVLATDEDRAPGGLRLVREPQTYRG